MMLARTADNLYWIARYVERAENLARTLRVTDRLSLMPSGADTDGNEWHSTVIVSGAEQGFYDKHEEATPENVISYLAFDPENPSSIRNCLEAARRNARAVRTALTSEQWECLNSAWLELPRWNETRVRGSGLHRFLDWVKDCSLLFTGGTVATMLRRDSYYFTRLGTFIERSDNTARILDVKYHVLLPEHAEVGGGAIHPDGHLVRDREDADRPGCRGLAQRGKACAPGARGAPVRADPVNGGGRMPGTHRGLEAVHACTSEAV